MRHSTQAFLQILLIELKDLECDIELLIEKYTRDHDEEHISNYVFYENVALMQNELFGVEGFYRFVLTTAPEQFPDIETLYEALSTEIQRRCRQIGLARSVCTLITRKMKKVRNYIEHKEIHQSPAVVG